jgi:hypothetical protein
MNLLGHPRLASLATIALLLLIGACSVGPDTNAKPTATAKKVPLAIAPVDAGEAKTEGVAAAVIDAVTFAGGREFTCVIVRGSVACWGDNYYGQLGWGQGSGPWVENLSDVVSISLGEFTACAILGDRSLHCWGRNDSGQAGVPGEQNVKTPTLVAGLQQVQVVEVSVGTAHTCARTAAGKVLCWGDNTWSQLAETPLESTWISVPIEGLCEAATMASPGRSQCVLCKSGEVMCWGDQSYGQLGDGIATKEGVPYVSRAKPLAVKGLADVVELATVGFAGCARKAEGSVWCWGWNLRGALGNAGKEIQTTPTKVPGLSDAKGIWSKGEGFCVDRPGDEVWCWAGEKKPSYHSMRRDKRFEGGKPFATTDSLHSCIRESNGELWCWGSNREGQLGNGKKQDRKTRQLVTVLGTATEDAPRHFKDAIVVAVLQDGQKLSPASGRYKLGARAFTLRLRFHKDDALFVRVADTTLGAWTPLDGGSFSEANFNVDQEVFPGKEGQHYWHYQDKSSHRFDAPCTSKGDWLLCDRTVNALYFAKTRHELAPLANSSLFFSFVSSQGYGDSVEVRLDLR